MYDAIAIGVAAAFFALTWCLVRFCERLEGGPMTAVYWLALVVAVLLAAYLFVALFRPEKF